MSLVVFVFGVADGSRVGGLGASESFTGEFVADFFKEHFQGAWAIFMLLGGVSRSVVWRGRVWRSPVRRGLGEHAAHGCFGGTGVGGRFGLGFFRGAGPFEPGRRRSLAVRSGVFLEEFFHLGRVQLRPALFCGGS